MEAFEQWWILEAQNIVGVGRITDEEIAKEGYKAALEWVLDFLDYSQEHKQIKDKIYEELED